MALIFSGSFLIYLGSWLSAFVGIFLTLAFVQLLAMTTAFLGQIVAEHAYTGRRRLVLLLIGVLIFAAAIADVVADPTPESVRARSSVSLVVDRDDPAGALRGI